MINNIFANPRKFPGFRPDAAPAEEICGAAFPRGPAVRGGAAGSG